MSVYHINGGAEDMETMNSVKESLKKEVLSRSADLLREHGQPEETVKRTLKEKFGLSDDDAEQLRAGKKEGQL